MIYTGAALSDNAGKARQADTRVPSAFRDGWGRGRVVGGWGKETG